MMSLPLKYYQWLGGNWASPCGHQADAHESRLFDWGCHMSDNPPERTTVTPITGDASFRRHFRIISGESHYIAVDSPPDKENNPAFIQVAGYLAEVGVQVPHILAVDEKNGFFLLSDLGYQSYLDAFTKDNAGSLYEKALAALVTIQAEATVTDLPAFDRAALMSEMQLFADWLIDAYLGLPLPPDRLLESSFDFLADQALKQPAVFVHRDYHSRNLIHASDCSPGLLDFQDAVRGPYSYDVVSLLKDCYIRWPEDQIDQWAGKYYQMAMARNLPLPALDMFRRDFDLMGAQRHLKAAGIFARLFLRDKKPGYLADVPRTLSYIIDLNPPSDPDCYPELIPLTEWLRADVLPGLEKRSQTLCKP